MRRRWFLQWVALVAVFVLPLVLYTSSLASRSDVIIIIDVRAKNLKVYTADGTLENTYPIATGKASTPTPVGVFRISGRFSSAPSGFGTRFLGLNVPWGQYGIHGTNKPGSIGTNASGGCIRMRTRDAEQLYARVANGAIVIIENGPYGAFESLSPLEPGDRSAAVRQVQLRLRNLGFYDGMPDGRYGAGTVAAVRSFRSARGLPASDIVDGAVFDELGIILFE